jgi:hypothetical protein
MFEQKKFELLKERKELDARLDQTALKIGSTVENISEFLELVDSLPLSYKIATPLEKRDLLKTITSNLGANGKNVAVELRSPFRELAELTSCPTGAPVRGKPRTHTKKLFEAPCRSFFIKECPGDVSLQRSGFATGRT